ncbi:MAG: glycosyl transferase family 1 [Chloroflexi bacterium]|nr:MAG: glycosyl transferase family 1 [Chloroflexota bacterium]
MTPQPSVLVIASDTIGPRMAGSGIRYWNLARVLGAQQPVTLATREPVDLSPPPGVTLRAYGYAGASEDERGNALARLLAEHEVVVAQHLPYLYADPALIASRYIVVDLYAPWILEKLEYARIDPLRGEPNRQDDVTILKRLLSLGDFFICAAERQRDFWLGALAAAGRLELAHVAADPELRTLIDIVGFGLPEQPPLKTGPGPRGRFPAIGRDDTVLLWNGGMWNWLDPLTAIRATALLVECLPNVRLVFMGTRSPGAQVAEMEVVASARMLASDLGLLDRHVFFHDWVPYEERQNWLLEATVALSLHVATVEARFAYRTRLLDNIWCGVPTVATEGDILADVVRDEKIGVLVRPADAAGVRDAVMQVLDRDAGRAMRSNLAALAQRYTWEQVSRPLAAWCAAPQRLSATRGQDPQAEYLQSLERMYSDTAQYARHLEQVVAAKDAALQAAHAQPQPQPIETETARKRPDLGSLFRRNRAG